MESSFLFNDDGYEHAVDLVVFPLLHPVNTIFPLNLYKKKETKTRSEWNVAK